MNEMNLNLYVIGIVPLFTGDYTESPSPHQKNKLFWEQEQKHWV